jgi:molecular chaperone GrpE
MESSEESANADAASEVSSSSDAEQAACSAEFDDARERYLRLLADFDNYKKRMRQRTEEAVTAERKRLLTRFIEIYENLMAASDDINDDGLTMVTEKCRRMLEDEGIEEIDTVGTSFDYTCHHAVATECSNEHAEGIIIDQVRKGYRLGDSILKPAYVVVSKGDTNGKNDRN